MEEVIGGLAGVDHIFSDPPYLYLKGQAFDRAFDEEELFEQAKRLLPDEGFVALFGRGTSFYRWNTRLADLGFVFKEELVWDKRYSSAPCNALVRVHETIALHTKKHGKIRRVRVPYREQKGYEIESVVADIKRIVSALGNEKELKGLEEYVRSGKIWGTKKQASRSKITAAGAYASSPASIILRAVQEGMNEKSIITERSIRYGSVHPAEKPVRLAERIIALISDVGDVIYDPFMGSGTIGAACIRTGRKYIGSEQDGCYYERACSRLRAEQPLLGEEARAW
jgi:site-specific DNA-methyltransferase (adenine-specific)